MKRIYTLLLLLFCIFGTKAQNLEFTQLSIPAIANPLDITNTGIPGDNRLFVTERAGAIRIIDSVLVGTPTLLATPYLTIPNVATNGEGGLLGLAFDPSFASNGYFYVNYTTSVGGMFTSRISRFSAPSAASNTANGGSEVVIFELPQFATNHNGGDLAFGPDNMLYVPFGDGGSFNDPQENGQDSTTILGSMIRIDVSSLPYTIPPDNPYVGEPTVPDEIWSIGWRNPFRFSFDRVTGHMWIADVGQNSIEEIDVEPAGTPGGRNYGWDCYEGSSLFENVDCLPIGEYTFPVYEYNHGLGSSVTGGYVYRGQDFPDLVGSYIFTDYTNSANVWVLETQPDGSVTNVDIQTFSGGDALQNVAAIGEDADGEIYFGELINGNIYRVGLEVLPVTLVGFRGDHFNGSNKLQWETQTEINSSHFEVERSMDGKTFSFLGRVASSQNSQVRRTYTFQDYDPFKGVSYYRLKMVDFDGSSEYSDVISIRSDNRADYQFVVHPNPSSSRFTIRGSAIDDIIFHVYSFDGSLLIEEKLNDYTGEYQLNLYEYPDGMYTLTIRTPAGLESHQIIKE